MKSVARSVLITICVAVPTCGMVAAGLAWACSPAAYVTPISPRLAHPGDSVQIRGFGFTDKTIEVRMGGMSGPVLATAAGPDFAARFTVPGSMAPGVYQIAVVARGSQESDDPLQIRGETLEVVAEPAPQADEAPSSASPAPAAAGAPSAGAAQPSADRQAATQTSPAKNGKRTGAADRRSTPVNRADRRETSRTGAPRADRQVVRSAGRPVFAGSVAPATRAAPTASGAPQPSVSTSPTPRADGSTRARSGADTQAPRVTTATDRGTPPRRDVPSLSSPLDEAQLDAGPDSRLGIGLGIVVLGLGVVVSLAGFMVADARRRRVKANHPAPR